MIWRALRKHPLELLGLAALATLPSELLSQAMGWDLMNPRGYLAQALWFPAWMLCQLALLRRLGQNLNPEALHPRLKAGTLASAIGAEILLGLRFSVVVLLAALPAMAFLSIFGLEAPWARLALLAITALSAVPCLLWMLRRLLAPAVILWQGLDASQAIDESARLSRGRLRQLAWPLLGLNGIGLILEGLSALSGSGALLVMPLSFLLSSLGCALAYRILTL